MGRIRDLYNIKAKPFGDEDAFEVEFTQIGKGQQVRGRNSTPQEVPPPAYRAWMPKGDGGYKVGQWEPEPPGDPEVSREEFTKAAEDEVRDYLSRHNP